MGKCAQCGNDYDKSFEVKMGGRTMISTHLNARSRRSHRSALIAAAASSAMAWSPTIPSSAASIAPSRKASKAYAIAIRGPLNPLSRRHVP